MLPQQVKNNISGSVQLLLAIVSGIRCSSSRELSIFRFRWYRFLWRRFVIIVYSQLQPWIAHDALKCLIHVLGLAFVRTCLPTIWYIWMRRRELILGIYYLTLQNLWDKVYSSNIALNIAPSVLLDFDCFFGYVPSAAFPIYVYFYKLQSSLGIRLHICTPTCWLSVQWEIFECETIISKCYWSASATRSISVLYLIILLWLLFFPMISWPFHQPFEVWVSTDSWLKFWRAIRRRSDYQYSSFMCTFLF